MGSMPRNGKYMVRALAVLLSVLVCSNHSIGVTAWVGGPFTVVMTTPIAHVGESFSGSSEMPLAHDATCSLSISASNGSEVLKNAGGAALDTQYKVTGIADGDATWVDSTSFLSRTYSVPGNNTTTNITLWVQGTAPANTAPEAGAYSATITLTVTF